MRRASRSVSVLMVFISFFFCCSGMPGFMMISSTKALMVVSGVRSSWDTTEIKSDFILSIACSFWFASWSWTMSCSRSSSARLRSVISLATQTPARGSPTGFRMVEIDRLRMRRGRSRRLKMISLFRTVPLRLIDSKLFGERGAFQPCCFGGPFADEVLFPAVEADRTWPG